jgi:hypothetical protein
VQAPEQQRDATHQIENDDGSHPAIVQLLDRGAK